MKIRFAYEEVLYWSFTNDDSSWCACPVCAEEEGFSTPIERMMSYLTKQLQTCS